MKKLISLSAALVSVFAVNTVSANSTKMVNPANNHSYQRFDTLRTWTQAKNACAGLGAHLATITDQAENDWIVQNGLNFNNTAEPGVWLGATDVQTEGTWKWITGETWNYPNWDGGQPDNTSGIENYLHYFRNSTWNDWTSTATTIYLCEWEQPDNIYSQVINLADINHNGSSDYALLGEKGTNYILFVYDGSSQTLISQATVKAKTGYAVKSFTVGNDANGDGVAEIAVLVVKAGNVATLQLHDPVTGTIVNTLNLPKN